jgi:hypothetical protein
MSKAIDRVPAHEADRITRLEARVAELERFVCMVSDRLHDGTGAGIALSQAIKDLRLHRPAG